MGRRTHSLRPHAALVAVQVFFGTWPVVGKIALRALPSTGLVAFRAAGAAVLFALLHRATGRRLRLARRADYARLALYSLLGVILNQLLYTRGLALSTAINATILGSTIPIATLVVSWLMGHERPTLRVVLGTLVAAGGVVYLVNPAQAELTHDKLAGNVYLVLNTLAYGAYLAISQDAIKRYGALTVITWVFVMACPLVVPFGGYHLAATPLAHLDAHVWLAVLYIILVPTVGAYYLNAWALGRVAPTIVAIYIYLQPLIAFALAPLLLGERLSSRTLAAALVIFAGVALVTLGPRSRTLEEVSERPEALGH